jgi:hypothetical protein
VRVIGRLWSRLRLDWEIGLHRLPFFTQKVAVMLLGLLVATLALLGGLATLVGPPGADGPDHLVPGSTPRPPAPARPAPGQVGGRGQAAGGAAAARDGGAGGGQAAGAGGTGAGAPAGAAGRAPAAAPTPRTGAGGAAPPTTTAPATTTGQGGLPPLKEVVSSVVSTLLP